MARHWRFDLLPGLIYLDEDGGGGGGGTCANSPQLLCLAGRLGTANNPLLSIDANGIITGSGSDAHGLVLRSSPGAVSTSYFAVQLDTPTELDGDPGTGNFGFLVQDAPLTLASSGYFTGLVLGVNQADWTLKSGIAGIGGIVFGNSQFKLHPAPGESQTVLGVEAFEDDSLIVCDNGGSLYIINGINGVGMYQQLEALTPGSVLHVGPIYGIDFDMATTNAAGGAVNIDAAVGLHYVPKLSGATVGDAIGLDYAPQLGVVSGVRATIRSVDPLAAMLHAGRVFLGDATHDGFVSATATAGRLLNLLSEPGTPEVYLRRDHSFEGREQLVIGNFPQGAVPGEFQFFVCNDGTALGTLFGAATFSSNSLGTAPTFFGLRGRGSFSVPAPTIDQDLMLYMVGTSAVDGKDRGGLKIHQEGTDPTPGGRLNFVTLAEGGVHIDERLWIRADGRVQVLQPPIAPESGLLFAVGVAGLGPIGPFVDGVMNVDVAGNLATIRNVSGYVWPGAHAVGVLTNDGVGNLSWTIGGTGPVGPMGFPGFDGDDGMDSYIPGPMGLTGATGAIGATGPQGIPGLDGIDGEDSLVPGPQGPIGLQGIPGVMGLPGFDGDDGMDSYLPGPAGPIGATGASGPIGPSGLDGLDGEDSYIPGPAGAVGATGALGPQGFQGIPGIAFDGEDGLDSYVVGPQGPQGIPGVQGVPGLDGEDALDFPIPGPTGATGATGLTGPQGIPGIAFDGEDGLDSYIPGPQGLQGLPGPQGVPGLDGEDALDFPIPGPTGATGATGLTGPQGPPGIAWLDDSTWDDASVLAFTSVPGTASNITDMGNFTALGASHQFGTAGVSCVLKVGQGTTGTDSAQVIINSGNSGTTQPILSLQRNSAIVTQFSFDGTNVTLGYTGVLNFAPGLIVNRAILDANGRFSKYGNIATVLNGIPSELANIDTTGLTANVAAALLYAVPAASGGLYRVSALVVETTAASASSTLPNVQVVYTDNQTGGTITLDATPILGIAGIGQTGALTANAIGTTASGVIVINAKASTNINYQTVNYASTNAGMTYALHIRLEALG